MNTFSIFQIFFLFSLLFQNYCISLPSEWEGPALAVEALCSILASENLGNFHARAEISRRAERLPRIMRGAVLHFLISGFPRTFTRNWQKQSRASAV